jgi:hypothetical protein
MLSIAARRALRVLLQGGYFQIKDTWNPLPREQKKSVTLRRPSGEIVPPGGTHDTGDVLEELHDAGLIDREREEQMPEDMMNTLGILRMLTPLERLRVPRPKTTLIYRLRTNTPS